MDFDSRARGENAGLWDEVLPKILNISYKDHVTNKEVRRKIQATIGKYDELIIMIKKQKLRWFGYASRSSA